MKASDRQVGGNHYVDMRISPVEFIYANDIPFLEGCIIKRVCRHRSKNGREDIEKAIHELQLILEYEYEPQESASEKSPGTPPPEPHREGPEKSVVSPARYSWQTY